MLLLDEPTAGMGREDIGRIGALIKAVAANRTVLMVEHNLSVVADLCDRITVLTRGHVLAEGDYETVSNDPAVIAKPISGPVMPETRPADGQPAQCLVRRVARPARRRPSTCSRGEVVTLLGRNGAGKTTTLRAIMGIIEKRSGSVAVRGQETDPAAVRRDRAAGHRASARRSAASSPRLNVKENLLLPRQVQAGGMTSTKSMRCSRTCVSGARSQGTKLSGGEQQMLAIARILRTGARLLLLDEPTEGLAPVIVQQIGRTIGALKARGFTILLVEQNFRFAATVADRHYVMEHGTHRRHDSPPRSSTANTGKLHELSRQSESESARCRDFRYPLAALFGQLLLGLINGSFYAMLSLGLAVIFGLLDIINFAHGAQYMIGAFVAWMLLQYLGIGYWAALVLAPS